MALCTGFAIFVLGGPSSATNWSHIQAVTLESDDWGLAGFVPREGLWAGLDRHVLDAGPAFPDVYWESTLEDSTMVADLCAILASHLGSDGLPPVFQPNYVISSLAWDNSEGPGLWRPFDFPGFSTQYSRPGMWEAVQLGIKAGLWYPEFHATFHYDPNMRRENALAEPSAREITNKGILLFPGSEFARELGPWRGIEDIEDELIHSLSVFEENFHRKPGSIVAPDYTWDQRIEQLWERHDQVVIQAKREQRHLKYGFGVFDRVRKFISRRFDYQLHSRRTYLERNCRFEPVQRPDHSDPEAMAEMVDLAVKQTVSAWKRGEPAIVETHRINYAHTDPRLVELGQDQLDAYLSELLAENGDKTVFLVDMEIAQLYRNGTSICLRGETLVVRNATHSGRMVSIPQEMLESINPTGTVTHAAKLVFVGPGSVVFLNPQDILP